MQPPLPHPHAKTELHPEAAWIQSATPNAVPGCQRTPWAGCDESGWHQIPSDGGVEGGKGNQNGKGGGEAIPNGVVGDANDAAVVGAMDVAVVGCC